MFKTVIDMLQSASSEWADRVAYQDETKALTFSELKALVWRVATKVARTVPYGSPVVIHAPKSPVTPALYMGVLAAGCYYAPLGSDVPAERVTTITEIVKPELVLTEKDLENLPAADNELVQSRVKNICDKEPQYIIFTSGSTGKPKGVVTAHRSVVDYVSIFAETFDINKKDILGSQAPLEYIAGIRDMFLPLLTGAKTVMIPKPLFSTPVKLFEFTEKHNVNTICWVAPVFALIQEFDAFKQIKPKKIKKLCFTGSVMQPKVLGYLQNNLPDTLIANHYGPTEITASCTYFVCGEESYEKGIPIGVAFPNRDVFILSENGGIAKEGEIGEICVRGVCVALGYFRDKAKTAEVFVQNPLHNDYPETIFKTGDLGYMRNDGNLMYCGRRDNQIKLMGYRIELSEIDFYASGIEGVAECVCLFDEPKNVIYLFYSGKATDADIAVALRAKLQPYMIPRKFVKLDALPKMFNGKVDNQKLKTMFKS